MSDIETKAKDSLKPLIFPSGPVLLTIEDQCAIALWATLRTMIFDSVVAPKRRHFSDSERAALARGDTFIPDNTLIWLAFYNSPNHRAYFDVFNARTHNAEGDVLDRFHLMTCLVDQLAIQLVTRTAGFFELKLDELRQSWSEATVEIWPNPVDDIRWPPKFYLGDSHFETFRDRFKPKKP